MRMPRSLLVSEGILGGRDERTLGCLLCRFLSVERGIAGDQEEVWSVDSVQIGDATGEQKRMEII